MLFEIPNIIFNIEFRIVVGKATCIQLKPSGMETDVICKFFDLTYVDRLNRQKRSSSFFQISCFFLIGQKQALNF